MLMAGVWGNYHLTPSHAVPSYQLSDPIFHVNENTTVDEITEFYNSHRQPGDSRGAMKAAQRLDFYRSHLPKMEYKGFVFFMDLSRNGKIADFLTVREIEINNKGQIKLYKVVPDSVISSIEMFGFDPDAPKMAKMTQLHNTNSGKQYFAGNEESTWVMMEYLSEMNKPAILLTIVRDQTEFNEAEFVFNRISQLYTSHNIDFP
jgi:hypothetical protein